METVKADNKQRVRIPDIKPGQVFALEINPSGTVITLHQVKKVESEERPSKVRFVKRGRYTVGHTDKQVSPETIKELLSEFP
jgi:hypothetical protein